MGKKAGEEKLTSSEKPMFRTHQQNYSFIYARDALVGQIPIVERERWQIKQKSTNHEKLKKLSP